MATITCLPDEMIIIILGYNNISIEDIINFRCVCKQFGWTVQYNKYFWEKKYTQRWPSAKKVYNEQSQKNEQKSEENERKDKRNFMETGLNCTRELRSYVYQIIHKHYYYHESIHNYNKNNRIIDNLMQFEEVFYLDKHLKIIFNEIISKSENFIKYSFFIDEIKNLLTQSPRKTGCDLTERYFNIKLFHYMRQCSVKEKWHRFICQSDKNQLLERKATMVAQWFQPEKDVFYSCVKASLNSIAVEVRNCLREKHPDHSIFLTSDETFSYWESNNIDDNHWNEAEGMQIMDTLDEYIFGKLNFQRNQLEDTNLKYMCIDNVLKNKFGHEIIILIIYHSVARRLGLRCYIIQPDFDRCFIYWKPIYAINSPENVRCFNISFEKFPNCLVNQLYPRVSDFTIRQEYRILDLIVPYQWYNLYDGFILVNMLNGSIYRTYEYADKITFLRLYFYNITMQLNTRPDDVKFAVGMIVTHVDQHTNSCVGVIVGWHRHNNNVHAHKCTIHINSKFKPLLNTCDILPLNHCRNYRFIKGQTNYIILTENNKMCYVEEDAITLTTPKWIDNSEIGRYFCKFEDTHYVPNEMLARLFPHDAAITANTAVEKQ